MNTEATTAASNSDSSLRYNLRVNRRPPTYLSEHFVFGVNLDYRSITQAFVSNGRSRPAGNRTSLQSEARVPSRSTGRRASGSPRIARALTSSVQRMAVQPITTAPTIHLNTDQAVRQYNNGMTEEEALNLLLIDSDKDANQTGVCADADPRWWSLNEADIHEQCRDLASQIARGCFYHPGKLNTVFQDDIPSLQIVFILDSTGSMFQCIAQVRSKLQQMCTQLLSDLPDTQIAIIVHGDYCDRDVFYTMHKLDFSSDLDHMGIFMQGLVGTGGGDAEECYEFALREANKLNWHNDCSNKVVVLIGDDIPHDSSTYMRFDWHFEAQRLISQGIRIHTVQALQRDYATDFYQELANIGNGHYLTLDRFESMQEVCMVCFYKEIRMVNSLSTLSLLYSRCSLD